MLLEEQSLWKSELLFQLSNFQITYKQPYMKGSNNIYFLNLYNNIKKTEVDKK